MEVLPTERGLIMRAVVVGLMALVLAAPALAVVEETACEGVYHERIVGAEWTTHEMWSDAQGTTELEVEFTVFVTGQQVTVEVYNWLSGWTGVGNGVHDGTKIRFTVDGGININFADDDCDDVLEPEL